jgi:hypothetical protein
LAARVDQAAAAEEPRNGHIADEFAASDHMQRRVDMCPNMHAAAEAIHVGLILADVRDLLEPGGRIAGVDRHILGEAMGQVDRLHGMVECMFGR